MHQKYDVAKFDKYVKNSYAVYNLKYLFAHVWIYNIPCVFFLNDSVVFF